MITNKIKVLRAEKNWTQDELASKVNVTRQTIASIENGKYSLSLKLAFSIAEAFDKDLSEVFQYIKEE